MRSDGPRRVGARAPRPVSSRRSIGPEEAVTGSWSDQGEVLVTRLAVTSVREGLALPIESGCPGRSGLCGLPLARGEALRPSCADPLIRGLRNVGLRLRLRMGNGWNRFRIAGAWQSAGPGSRDGPKQHPLAACSRPRRAPVRCDRHRADERPLMAAAGTCATAMNTCKIQRWSMMIRRSGSFAFMSGPCWKTRASSEATEAVASPHSSVKKRPPTAWRCFQYGAQRRSS